MQEAARSKIGARIREIRKKRGLTQEELSEKVGVSSKFIGSVERGEAFASFRKIELIADALECDMREFFEIDYLDLDKAQMGRMIKKKLSLLSQSDLRTVLKMVDFMAQ